jgi:D-glycero-D-manno-heptose 1,7-bisphosphate phosphatase
MLVLLDRDGVINRDAREGILSLDAFEFLPRAIEAVALLSAAGFKVAICTNQSAVGRGILAQATLDNIHAHMCREIEHAGGRIDRIYVAPDKPEAASERRKPGAGMLLEALGDFHADAAKTFFVGDMLRDMQAAHKAGCPFILVRCGKGSETLSDGIPPELKPAAICDDLLDAAQYIIKSAGA